MDEGRKDMTDAPETIWAKEGHDSWGQYGDWYRDNKGGGTEYTRIDVSDAGIEAKNARIAELEAALMGYKEEYCEFGSDLCGLLSNDSCGGCYAANALQAKT